MLAHLSHVHYLLGIREEELKLTHVHVRILATNRYLYLLIKKELACTFFFLTHCRISGDVALPNLERYATGSDVHYKRLDFSRLYTERVSLTSTFDVSY